MAGFPDLSCFKAYDIRGKVPQAIDARVAYALGLAMARQGARKLVVGHDARLSGPELSDSLVAGFNAGGGEAHDLGMCGTEEIYFAASRHPYDMGVMVTGSHNPADENGFKLVRAGAVPVSGDSGLKDLKTAVAGILPALGDERLGQTACAKSVSYREEYLDWLCSFVAPLSKGGRRLSVVADAGNGCAGLVLQHLAGRLGMNFTLRQMEPDGNFPNGVPNPLLPERRAATSQAVIDAKADIGLAWDGDFDRCFFYDSKGQFVEGYYLVGLLAQAMLTHQPGGKIVHDPRVYWNTRDMVLEAGGVPVMGKTGHAFMKERMRAEDAIYGGEMSAHHYFRDFAYCDSGMLPWLLVTDLLCKSGKGLAELVEERMQRFPCSGEINRRVVDAPRLMETVRQRYAPQANYMDTLDGINLEFQEWRFNLRMSNTEPLLRLNVETRGNKALVEDKTAEILEMIDRG